MSAPKRPDFIRHVHDLPDNGGTTWPWVDPDEVLGLRTSLSRPLGLMRVGVHHDRLRPGERSSHPHAEGFEEECVYVLSGHPVARIDGTAHALEPGDFCAFAPGTGIQHSIENQTDTDVCLLVVGERLDSAEQAAAAWLALWNGPDAPDAGACSKLFTPDAHYANAAAGVDARGADVIREALADLAPRPPRERLEIVPSADRFALQWAPRGAAPRGVSFALLDGLRPRIRSLTDHG